MDFVQEKRFTREGPLNGNGCVREDQGGTSLKLRRPSRFLTLAPQAEHL